MPALLAEVGLGPEALAALGGRLEPWTSEGLLRIEGPRWRLSDPAGLALSNGVLRELLAWWQEQQQLPGQGDAGWRSSPAALPPPGPDLAAAAG